LTASIIVRIAVKHATYRSLISLRLVTADPKKIHIQLDADARLAAGAGGAVRFIAESAGLESKEAGEFQGAAVAVFETALSHVTPTHPHVDVYVVQFNDRLEVTLSQEGNATSRSMEAFGPRSGSAPRGVDEIKYGHEGNVSITRLTKYLTPHS
jgi:hypothetical protein